MKNKIVVYVIFLIILVLAIGCSNKTSSEDADNVTSDQNVNTENDNQEDITSNEVSSSNEEDIDSMEVSSNNEEDNKNKLEPHHLSEEDGKIIVKEFWDEFISAINNNDRDHFKTLFDPSIDETMVSQNFDGFKSQIDQGLKEDLDIELMFFTDDIIGASIYMYTNLKSGSKTNHSSFYSQLYLEKMDERWKISISNKLNEFFNSQFQNNLKDKYGEEYVTSGYVSGNHEIYFNKVLRNNLHVDVRKMKPGKEGSVDIEIALINGYDNDVFDIKFNKLLFNSGPSDVIFADLSGIALESSDIVYSKTIKTLSLNIKKEDLLVPVNEIDFTNIGVSSEISNSNRD